MSKKKTSSYNTSIINIFKNISNRKKLNFRQIKSRLQENNIILIKKSLDSLEKQGVLNQVSPGSYIMNTKKTVLGTIDKTKKGSGYLIVENNEKDFFISEKNIKKALNGDTVECVKITNREVEVVKVIKRKKQRYVGVVFSENNQKFIDYNSNKDKVVFICNDKNIKDDDIVVFEINKWEDKLPKANVLKTLGEKGCVNNEIHAILEEFELPYEFDKTLIKEAELLKNLQNNKEDLKRKCFRDITTFTIDPVDAKDFDDAISFKKLSNNSYEIGVHIADVSHYLKPNTILDKEVLECAIYALEHKYASIVIQAGERTDNAFTSKITSLLKEIDKISKGKLGITLSLGEQSIDTYKAWFDAGAHRYLLRIESSTKQLYNAIHPNNELHNFENRMASLHNILTNMKI